MYVNVLAVTRQKREGDTLQIVKIAAAKKQIRSRSTPQVALELLVCGRRNRDEF